MLCRSRELLIHGGREGLSRTRTPSETAVPTSAQSYVGPSHQGVCVCAFVGLVGVWGWKVRDYITCPPALFLACSLRGMEEGQAYFVQGPYSFSGLLFLQSTEPTRVCG